MPVKASSTLWTHRRVDKRLLAESRETYQLEVTLAPPVERRFFPPDPWRPLAHPKRPHFDRHSVRIEYQVIPYPSPENFESLRD